MLRLQLRVLLIFVTVPAAVAGLFGWTEFFPVAIFGAFALIFQVANEASIKRLILRRIRLAIPRIPVVVDARDVMQWKTSAHGFDAQKEVLARLSHLGLAPVAVFREDIGDLFPGQYPYDRALVRRTGLPRDRVLVVPKGTPADEFILASARDLGARIVTNDRYRDWADRHPEVREPGRLVRGGYRDGALWLDMDAAPVGLAVGAAAV